jgi:hypothetical protein
MGKGLLGRNLESLLRSKPASPTASATPTTSATASALPAPENPATVTRRNQGAEAILSNQKQVPD